MLTVLVITVALMAGVLLLALASDAFGYELSRGVEAALDFFEYRAALRRQQRQEYGRTDAEVGYEAYLSHAG